MRRRLWLVASSVCIVVAASTVSGATSAAADVTPTVSNVSVTPSSVSVDGLGDALVTVQLDIDEPRGTPMGSGQNDWYCLHGPCAYVYVHDRSSVRVDEVPGTRAGSRATFRGSFLVGSTSAGTWTAEAVAWFYGPYDADWVEADITGLPTADRTTTIAGSNPPTLSSVMIPPVVAYGARQWVRYTFRAGEGRPLVGRYVDVCNGMGCFLPDEGAPRLSTDAHGQMTVRAILGETTWTTFHLPSTAEPGAWVTEFSVLAERHEYFASVTPSAPRAVRRGHTITVRVVVSPGQGATVVLQRLVGRHWRSVARAPVRASGAAFVTTASVLGRQFFRARAQGGYVTTTSRVFVVIGSRR